MHEPVAVIHANALVQVELYATLERRKVLRLQVCFQVAPQGAGTPSLQVGQVVDTALFLMRKEVPVEALDPCQAGA